MEKIVIGDGVYYANYKAPFQQLEGATPGYPLGELPYDVDGRLLCPYVDRHQPRSKDGWGHYHETPKTFLNLGAHLAKKHDMDAGEFKAEAGLNEGAALVSESTRLRNVAHGLRLRASGKFRNPDPEVSRRVAALGARKGGKGTRTPQALNKRGCCYDQVLRTAQQIQSRTGRLTLALLRKEGIQARIIELHFGSWQAFLQRMGESTQRSGVVHRDADLIHDLRSMAQALGHTPTVSDGRRYQMASRKAYENHFGSWVQACELAGIQPNVPAVWSSRPATVNEDAALLSAYAMTGNITKAAGRIGISPQRASTILARYGMTPLNGNGATHVQRLSQMALAATMSRRLVGIPEAIPA